MVKCRTCNKGAVFNLPSETKGRFCKEHKTPEMKDVVNPKCNTDGCSRQPCYNIPGERKGLYCREHKKDGMVDIKDRDLCEHSDCSTRAGFNFDGELVPKFCNLHKSPDMVYVCKRITCSKENCNKVPIFGLEHGKALFCKEHKEPNSFDVKHNSKCLEEACSKRPTFNYSNETVAIYCVDHKKDNMVNVLEKRLCRHNGCQNRAYYGIELGKPEYCNDHKDEKMTWVVVRRNCAYEDCMKYPTFGFHSKDSELFCKDHKKDGMVDVRHTRCKTPMCDTRPVRVGYCTRCYIYTFPDAKVSRNFKTKELAVREFLQATFPNVTIIHDKRVDCFLYRPDFSIDMGSHVVIIENDEKQHASYDTSCENKRLMSIFQGFGCRPIVLIRFNPDGYDNVKGCWTRGCKLVGDGSTWRKRLDTLRIEVELSMNCLPKKEVNVLSLFYDKV